MSGWASATRATPSAIPRRPSPQFSRRWAVTTTIRLSLAASACSSGFGELDVDLGGPLEGVDAGAAGDEDLADGDVLADQILHVGRGRREVHGGDRRDHLAVELLRERRQVVAVGAQTGLDVHHRHPQVEGGERGRHRRAGVAVDEDGGRVATGEDVGGARVGVGVDVELLDAEVFEALHHRGDPLVQVGPVRAGPEGDVGLDAGELEDVLGGCRRRSGRPAWSGA